ncbi:MAG: hypothetical protein ACXVFG_14140, partial [Gaiellaceae bacterium]
LDNVELQVNNFSGGATVLDWTHNLDLNNDTTFGGPADQLIVNTVPVDLTSDLTKVEGDLTSLNIANVVSGSAHFEVTKRTTTVDSSGHVPVTLVTFGLSNLHLSVGTDAFGVSITSGSVAIASARPIDTADTRRWVAVVGHELGASLNLGGFVTATLQHVELKVNSVSGSGTPTVLDWTSDLDLNGDGTFGADPADQLSVAGVAIDLTDDKTVVAGDLTNLNIADLVTGSAHFEVTKQTIHVNQGGSVAATLMTFGLSSLNLTVGTSTFGVTINSGSVAIAAITPTDTSDTRRWLGVRGTELGATLNLGGFVTATLQHVEVRVNRFSGGATALNWLTSLDLNNDGTFGADPADKLSVVLVPINLTTDEVFVAGDLTGLDIAGLVSGSAHFEVKKQTIQVNQGSTTSATLLTFGLSNLNLTVGTSSFGLTINAGSIAIAAITPTIGTDTRRWLAVKGTELGASLNLGGLVTATLQHVTVSVNNFSGGATVLNWLTSLNLNGNATFGENPADRLTVAGVLIDLTDDQTIVSGDLASLDIAGLVSGSAHFELKRQTIHVTNSPAVEATLLTFALSNLSLSVGTPSFGVTINGGSIAIAAITPTATTDPRRWLAVKGTDLSATLNLGSFATAVADHVSVMVNRFSGTGATALNWDTSLDLNNDTTFGDSLSVNGTPFDDVTQEVTQIAGNLKLRIGTFVYVSGGFSLIKTDTFVTLAGATTTTHVSLLEIGIHGGTVFAGIGNPDTSGDGFFDSADNITTSGAVGISLTNVTLGLALMSDIPTSGASTKNFMALRASGTASLVGITGIDVVGTLEVDYNTASDSTLPSTTLAPVVDFTKLAAHKLTIPTGPSPAPSIDIAFDDRFLKISGTAMLKIEDFVFISAAFSITQEDTPTTVTLEKLTPTDTPPTRSVTTLKIGVSAGNVFVGVGGPYFVVNSDGSVSEPSSAGGAMGLALTNVTLALALFKPTDPAQKAESYYALKASGGVHLVGITGLTLIVDTIGVEVNGANGSPGNRAVDFIASYGAGGLHVDTGTPPGVDLKFENTVLRAFGKITLTIGTFVYVSGSFSFEKGTTLSATLTDGTPVSLSVLKIGATGVKAFVGLNGPYWASDGTLDPGHASAIGIVLDGVEFGLALMKPTTASTRSFYALKATATTVSVQVPFAGVGLTVTGLELQVNGSSDSALPVVNLKAHPIDVPTGESTSVTLGGATSDFDKMLLRASGHLTLTFADLTLQGGVFFESATDATLGRIIKVALTDVSVDFADFLQVAGVDAFLVVTSTGVAAKISVPLSFNYPNPIPTNGDPYVAFSANASLEINTTGGPVHVSIGSDTFDLSDAGPYFRIEATNVTLTIQALGHLITVHADAFLVDQITRGAVKIVRIAATGVSITTPTAGVPGAPGPFTLTNGKAAIVLYQNGMAGVLSGAFSVSATGIDVSAQETILTFNTRPVGSANDVHEHITVAGGDVAIDAAANTVQLTFRSLSINIANLLTLSGDFTSTTQNGHQVYAARNVEIFLGQGPYRLANGDVNPDAIGIVITNATVGIVKIGQNYAVYAEGHLAIVGLGESGGTNIFDVSGTVRFKYNTTGQSVNETINLPGTPVESVTVNLPAQRTEIVEAGFNAAGQPSAPDALTISIGGVVNIVGAVRFTIAADDSIAVEIRPVPGVSTLSIKVPFDGTYQEIFGISGTVRFAFGGGQGFHLEDLRVSGFSIFGHGATISSPATLLRAPIADLASPSFGEYFDVTKLNDLSATGHGYIDVRFTDFNGTGIDPDSITDDDPEFVLSGAGATGLTINGHATQVDPNDPYLFRYAITAGSFTPTATDRIVELTFLPHSFNDMSGAQNVTEVERFSLTVPTQPSLPAPVTGTLTGQSAGGTTNLQTIKARKYIDISLAPTGMTVDESTLDGTEISVLGPSGSTLTLKTGAPIHVGGNTYRYVFTDTSVFAAGEVSITVNPNKYTVNTSGGPLQNSQSTSKFTVASDVQDGATASNGLTLGPLTLNGPSLSIADMHLDGGKLIVTVAIGMQEAKLAFGGGSPTGNAASSGVEVKLTGVLAKFDVSVDLLTALSAIAGGNFSAIVGAFDTTGDFSVHADSVLVNVPNLLRVTASGIDLNWFNNYDPAKHGGAAKPPLFTITSGTIALPSFNVTAPFTGLVVDEHFFSVQDFQVIYTPSGGPIKLGSILQFNDLRLKLHNFKVEFSSSDVTVSGDVLIGSGGVVFLPGMAVHGSILDGPDQDTDAISVGVEFAADGSAKSFLMDVDQLSITFGSFLTISAEHFKLNTGAGPTEELASFASVGAEVSLPFGKIKGEARNFAFLGNGTFVTKPGFGVFLTIGGATGADFMWPDWLPIKITEIGIQWPDIQADPGNFVLILSASVDTLKGIPNVEVTGAVRGLKIDLGLLRQGKFPVTDIAAFAVSVHGNLFGGEIDAALVIGILKVDASGHPIGDLDTTTPVADRVLYGGLQGAFGMAGFKLGIRVGLSQLGPLGVFLEASLPTGIVIVPQFGIAINDFVAGVEFFKTLPSIDSPFDLRGPDFNLPTAVPADQWLDSLRGQVATQYLMVKQNPNMNGFFAAFTSPMTITGSAKIYDIYTSQELFNGQVIVKISTDGKFLVVGKLNFAADNISVSGRLYADLSRIASGNATVLFLADVPDQVRLLTIYGKLKMGFRDATGQEVEFTVPEELPTTPTGSLAGPGDGSSVSLGDINGRGYLDVTYTVPSGSTLDTGSITDLDPEFTISSSVTTDHITTDDTQAPILISGTKYRYWTKGNVSASANITLTFAAGTWATVDNAGKSTGNTASTTTLSGTDLTTARTTLNRSYIDVKLATSAPVDESTVDGNEIVLSGPGVGTATTHAHAITSEKPTKMDANGLYWRIYVEGDDFLLGDVNVAFPASTWKGGTTFNVATNGSKFTVEGPTSTVSSPITGNGSIDVDVINGARDGLPLTAPSAAAGATSGSVTGTFVYAISFSRGASEAGIGPASAQITVTSGSVVLSDIPVGPDGTTSRRVYRKQIDGTDHTFHLIGSAITNNDAGVTFEDNNAAGGSGAAPQTSPLYIDVTFKPTTGNTIDYATILDSGAEFTLSGAALNSVAFNGAPTAIALVTDSATGALVATPVVQLGSETPQQFYARLASLGVTRFRYLATTPSAAWGKGTLTLTWSPFDGTGGGWQDKGGNPNLSGSNAPSILVSVQGPTADLADPLNGGAIDINKLNGRGYVDVIFSGPPSGFTIDYDSIRDLTPEFRLSGDGVGTVSLDNSQAPLVLDEATGSVRYWVNGTWATGDVHALFIPGSWSFKKAVSPTDATVPLTSPNFINVTFPSTPGSNYAIDPASVTGNEISLSLSGSPSGHTIALDPSQAPIVDSTNPLKFRFAITGTNLCTTTGSTTTCDSVIVHFFDQTWSFVDTTAVETDSNRHGQTNNRQYLDVIFHPTANGTSVTGIDSTDVSLSGTTVTIASAAPDHISGNRYRFYLTGVPFGTGLVTVNFAAGGFTSGSYTNLADTEQFTVLGPTADLTNPSNGAITGLGAINGRGYIDITFTVATGRTLDEATITDSDPEFTISSTSTLGDTVTGQVALDTSQAPVRLTPNANTFRYWTKGHWTSTGNLTVTFLTNSYGYTDSSTEVGTPTVAADNFRGSGVPTTEVSYLDVQLSPTFGDTLNAITDGSAVIELSGDGAGTASPRATAPTQLPGTSVYRFYFTGDFAPGTLNVKFKGNSFSSQSASAPSPTPIGNLEETEHLVLQQLTGDIADPNPGGAISTDDLNNRGYVDVTYTVPNYATSLDISSITDLDPEFTFSSSALTVDSKRAPIPIGTCGSTCKFRYFFSGVLPSGAVSLNFIGGSVSYLDAFGKAIPNFAPRSLTVGASGSTFYVDVPFGTTAALVGSSIASSSISLPTGYSISGSPAAVTGQDGVYRFTITAGSSVPALAAGQTLTVTYVGGWNYGSGKSAVVENSQSKSLTQGTFIDIHFNSTGGVALDPTSISGNEISLSGSGLGTGTSMVQLDSTHAPTFLSDGQTVRYYLTGTFVKGGVTVTFNDGSWADVAGNTGTAGSESFMVTEALASPTPSAPNPSKVFFIEISGGLRLDGLGFTGDEPIFEIRGRVSLEVGNRPIPGGGTKLRFDLDASGTITVIKLGNIASGAAHFVLETGGLNDIQFWGVAAFATNFDFLRNWNITLSGEATLQINMTDDAHSETISLEGIPGDELFNTAFATAGLPTSDLLTFHNLTDPTVLGYFSAHSITLSADAQIEQVVSNQSWKIKDHDKQYFIEKARNATDTADILSFKGEARTYNLAPKSLALEILGLAQIANPSNASDIWFDLRGAFFIRITDTRFEMFLTATGTIKGGFGGSLTGLMIIGVVPHGGPGGIDLPFVAGMLNASLTLGAADPNPDVNAGNGVNFAAIANFFEFHGSAKVMFNSSGLDQPFLIPQEILNLMPPGTSSSLTVFGAPPNDQLTAAQTGATPGPYVAVKVSGSILLKLNGTPLFTMTGTIGFVIGTTLVRITGAVSATIPYIGGVSGSIDFAFFTDYVVPTGLPNAGTHIGPGLVGRATLAVGAGGAIPGVKIAGQFLFEITTFAQDVQLQTFVTRYEYGSVTDPGSPLGSLLQTNTGTGPVTNPKPGCSGTFQPAEFITCNHTFGLDDAGNRFNIRLLLNGDLTISNIVTLHGAFEFEFEFHPQLVIRVGGTADIVLSPIGSFHTSVGLEISSHGIAASFSLNIAAGANFGHDVGLGLSGNALVQFNTTGSNVTLLNGVTVAPGFRLHIDAHVDFLTFVQADGSVDIAIQSNQFTLAFDVTVHIGPIDVAARGFAGIYPDGIALALAVSFDVNVLGIVHIAASGELELNTTHTTKSANGFSIPGKSFRLALEGDISVLEVLRFHATFMMQVGGEQNVTVGRDETRATFFLHTGQWVFDFTADMDFFGLATLSAQGWVNSDGFFDFKISGRLVLGSENFGVVGQFSFRVFLRMDPDPDPSSPTYGANVYHFGLSFSASVKAKLFGITLAGLGLSASFEAFGGGSVDVVVTVKVTIDLLLGSITKTAHFKIGTLQLPKPVFLAGDKGGAADPQNHGVATWSTGELWLNMGGRASIRGVGEDEPDETFIIDHVSGVAGNETIKVTAMGRQQIFAGVTSIHGFGGGGNDLILVHEGVLSPVELAGGLGDDVLVDLGSGNATLYGDDEPGFATTTGAGLTGAVEGDDYMETGSGTVGSVTMWGGGGNDYMRHEGPNGATINGEAGSDTIFGSPTGNDTINGGTEADEISGRGGNDNIHGDAGNDVIHLTIPNGTSNFVVDGGADTDILMLTGSPSAENISVTRGSQDIRVSRFAGTTETGRVDGKAVEEVDIDLGAGADTITIGSLLGATTSTVTTIAVNAGQIVTQTGTQLVPSPADPNDKEEVPVFTTTPDGSADTIIINGTGSADVYTISTVTGPRVKVLHTGDAQVFVDKSVRSEGDILIVDGGGGGDNINASAVASDLLVLRLQGNTGDDVLVGSPFNDILDGGTGNDHFTGGPGLDTFIDSSPSTDTDTLIETFDNDMSLFQDTFVVGTLTDVGSTSLPSESMLTGQISSQSDPNFRQIGSADHYAAGATVESLGGLFEAAILTGGAANNTIVVNDIDNTIFIGGVARSVTPWQGHATLDNAGNSSASTEHYVVAININNHALIDIVDSGTGEDELVVFGTNQGDNLVLGATGSTGLVTAQDVATTAISYQSVDRVSIYTLDGSDRILSNDTRALTVVDTGAGGDLVTVGTVPLALDRGNRTDEFPDGPLVASSTGVTNGNSNTLFILGSGQSDTVTLNHNIAKVYVHGGLGTDNIVANTFVQLQGARYAYLQNADVTVNAGPGNTAAVAGLDSLMFSGTPVRDVLASTTTVDAGAGRLLDYSNVERHTIFGGAGIDEIYVLGTASGVETVADGGSGDDTIHVGGTPPALPVGFPGTTFTPTANSNVASIVGRLTIRGGDGAEYRGDTVIVHNQSGSSAAGTLTTRPLPRIVQVGADQNGNPLFGQASGPGGLITDTFRSVEGIGLGIPTGGRAAFDGTNTYFGIELLGVDGLDLRLAGGDDSFTVVNTAPGFRLTIAGGSGNDTVNLRSVSGPTRVLGGAGSDTLNVFSTTNTLADIAGRVLFEGDKQIVESGQTWSETSATGGTDTLNVVNTGDSSNVTSTLDRIPVPTLTGTNYLTATALYYLGGELAFDPITGLALSYAGGEPVLDLLTHTQLRDPFGNLLFHHLGDPVLHFAGDPIVHTTGDIGRYLGGETVLDEQGNPVVNPDSSTFMRAGGEAQLQNRRDPVYVLTDSTGHAVQLGSLYTPASFTNPAGGSMHLAFDVATGDLVAVTVYDPALTLGRGLVFNLNSSEFTVNTGTDTVAVLVGMSQFLTFSVTVAKAAKHVAGDQKQYFGDEALNVGDPIVDANGNLAVDVNGVVRLHTTATISAAGGFHRRGEVVLKQNPQGFWVPDTFVGGEAVLYLGNEAKRFFGGEPVFGSLTDPATAGATFQHIAASSMPGDVLYGGLESANFTLGNGDDLVTIYNTHTTNTLVNTTGGTDRIAIRTISGNTTIDAGTGNDTVDVGSTAGLWNTNTPSGAPSSNPQFIAVNGIVDGIGAVLTLHGGGDKDSLNVDDSGDTNNNTGTLTSTRIDGLDMGGHIEYDGFASSPADDLNIVLGHGDDVFTILSTHTGLTTLEGRSGNDELNIQTISAETRVAGDGFSPTLTYGTNTICTGIVGINVPCGLSGGDDVVNVGTQAGVGGRNFEGNLQGIGAALIVQGGGQGDIDRLNVDDSADLTGRSGLLQTTTITGLGMAAAGITYTQFEALHATLGFGNDLFHIATTHFGTTRISGGPGNDRITVESIQGATQIEGDDPVIPVSETFAVVAKEFVRVQRILDSRVAISVSFNGTPLVYGTDYTFSEGDKLVNFTTPKTGTVVVTYNAVVN